MKPTITIKDVVINILDYLKYQVVNDKCTLEELKSIQNSLIDNLEIDCTSENIAEMYGQSPSNVRNILSRNFMPKPKRRVYYNFTKFITFIPKSWRRATNQ